MIVIVTPWWPRAGALAEGQFVKDEGAAMGMYDAVRIVVPPRLRNLPRIVALAFFVVIGTIRSLAIALRHRPCVIHGYVAGYGTLVAAIASRLTGCKAVAHELGAATQFVRGPVIGALARWANANCTASRTCSQVMADDVHRWSGRRPEVVPHPVARPQGARAERNGVLRVLYYAGSEDRRKGADLVEAAMPLANGMIEFTKVGGRPWIQVPDRRAARAEVNSHEFFGRLLLSSDLVICAGRFEGFGVTAFEAAAAGCAVACTRTGAQGDLIDMGAAQEIEPTVDSVRRLLNAPPTAPDSRISRLVIDQFGPVRIGGRLARLGS